MTAQNGPQYLSNLSNPVINNPIITHVSGNVYNDSNPERYGLKLLLANISTGAFHDAAERGDPPRCHPHTRMAIRAEIMEWIEAPTALHKLILWMYGPAGSGKTAIAQSVAEECKEQGLAASFFFGRTAAGRKDTTRFVATIAYQLSQSVPEIYEQIISAVEQNPTVFSRALATQMQVLLIEPLKSLPPSPTPIFVITDGVDECGPNRESQTILLNALGTAVSELRHIPLIFLIASRPEYEIREAFNGHRLSPLVKSLVLDEKYSPDDDIRLYLNSTFQEIYDKHLRLGSRFPSPWPAKADVDRLVSKASGQFIFASTVMKFIDTSRHHPQDRLNIILGLLAPGNETPFALLDALYHFILSSVADAPKVLEILMLVILGQYLSPLEIELNPTVIEELLDITLGTVLVDMHALMYVPPAGDRKSLLRFHHASLHDFLTDRSRSRNYYIDETQAHVTLSRRWLKLIANYSHGSIRLSLRQRVGGFVAHSKKLSGGSSDLGGDLASFSLKKTLDGIRSAGDLWYTGWAEFFDSTREHAHALDDVFPHHRLLHEFDTFVLGYMSRYHPALQDLIPTIMVSRSEISKSALQIMELFIYATYPLKEGPDPMPLHLCTMEFYDKAFLALFQNSSRAGRFYVDGGSFVRLAKEIIRAVYPPLETAKYRVTLQHNGNRCIFNTLDGVPEIEVGVDLLLLWLVHVHESTSTDEELAVLLRDRTLQYSMSQMPIAHEKIGQVSLEYIKSCGIPYLKHTHPPTTDMCIICAELECVKTKHTKGKHPKAKGAKAEYSETERAEAERPGRHHDRSFKKYWNFLFPS